MVSETSTEVEKAKRKKLSGEEYDVGRILGVVARWDDELVSRLKSYAEAGGKKVTELIYDALKLYDEYLMLSSVDVKSLMASLKLLEHLLKMIVSMMMTVNEYMSSQFFTQQVEILHKLREQQAEAEKKVEVKRKSEVKEQLMTSILSTVVQMLSNMLMSLSSIQMKSQGLPAMPQATQHPQIPSVIEKPRIVRGSAT